MHPDFNYVAAAVDGEVWILAQGLIENIMKLMGVRDYKVIRTFEAEELSGLKARHPFADRDAVIVLGTHVTLDAGTGAVHTAPGHGREDYEWRWSTALTSIPPWTTPDGSPMTCRSLPGSSSSMRINP